MGLYLADASGNQCRLLLRQPKGVSDMAVSPDGRRVAYWDSAAHEIVVSRVDGSERRVVAPSVTNPGPGWVSSHQLVYSEQPTANRITAVRIDKSAGIPARLSWPSDLWGSLSPDSKHVTFLRRWGNGREGTLAVSLNVMRADGVGGSRELYRGQDAINSDPLAHWSPGSRTLAVEDVGVIFRMRADGSGFRQITDPPTGSIDGDLSWSSDGTRIFFWRRRPGASDVYVVNSDGSDLRRLTFNKVGPDTWGLVVGAPDGRAFAYTQNNDADVAGVNGTDRRTICAATKEGNVTYSYSPAAWQR